MPRVGLKRVPECIRNRDVFDNYSSTLGSRRTFAGWGDLPAEVERPDVRSVTYWVYSYETPIAWVIEGGVTIPPVFYDSTTYMHQLAVVSGFGVRGWKVSIEAFPESETSR